MNGYYTDYHYWWYTFANQSYTWVGAYPVYNFLNYSGRGTPKNRSSDLVVGDILQANWGHGEGISHSMIVSTKHNDGRVYLSYHTNDTLDRPLSDIVATSPGASFYAWHINDTFSSLKPQTVVGKK